MLWYAESHAVMKAIDNTLASGLTAATGSMETAAEHLQLLQLWVFGGVSG